MASQTTPPARLTKQLAVLVTEETRERVDRDALNRAVSLGEIVRDFIDLGAEVRAIADEYGVETTELVNAARLHALRARAHDGVEIAARS